MTVENINPIQHFTSNGETTVFAISFAVEGKNNIKVTVNGSVVSVNDYSYDALTKAVVFNAAPEDGAEVVVERVTSLDRSINYQTYDNSFRPETLNYDFDRIWWKIQELGVADWILNNRIDALKNYVNQQDGILQDNIDSLKNYVDDRDDELRAYLLAEIQAQGVALDQLDEYYNYLMQRLAQIAVDKGWDASFVVDGGETQKQINTAQKRKNSERISIKDYGAIGDGVLHPLSEKYPTLAAAQIDYPHATALTDSIDWAAIQKAIKSLPLNTASTGILTPKGFANGGCIHVPRGRYVVNKKITLQRGLRLVGESRESSQFISFIGNDSVLQYTDSGRYIQDEILIENLSIWQDPSVIATAGAAIDVIEGPSTVQSTYMKVDNVYIEGTYYGIRHMSGVGSAIRNSNISKTELHGIYLTGVYSTTSMTFENTYCHSCKGDGYRIEKGAYLSFSGCASDSNIGYGYYINGTLGYQLTGCGAEQNAKSAMYLKSTAGGSVNLFAIGNAEGVVQFDNAYGETVFVGGSWNGTGIALRHVSGVSKARLIGTNLESDYVSQVSSTQVYLLNESSQAYGKLVGGTANRWSIGVTSTPDSESGFAIGGLGGVDTTIGLKVNQTFKKSGLTRTTAMYVQTILQDVSVTYPLITGAFIANAAKGQSATVERQAGLYVAEQTLGTLANANIMIDGGLGTVPVGNWSLYSGSTRPSYYAGNVSFKLSASQTPINNNDIVFELTNDTTLKIKVKGSDGVVRSASLTLA